MRFFTLIVLISALLFSQELELLFDYDNLPEDEKKSIQYRNMVSQLLDEDGLIPTPQQYEKMGNELQSIDLINPFSKSQMNDQVWDTGWDTDEPIYKCFSKAIHVENDSNVYVISEVYDVHTYTDVKIVKTDKNGSILWSYTYDEPDKHYDKYAGSFLKENGDLILVMGAPRSSYDYSDNKHMDDPDGGYIYFWLEFSSSGELISSKDMNSRDHVGFAEFTSFAFNENGSFFAIGRKLYSMYKIMYVDSLGNINYTFNNYYYETANPSVQIDLEGNPVITFFKIINYGETNKLRIEKFTKELISDWYFELPASHYSTYFSAKYGFDTANNIIILNNKEEYANENSHLVKISSDGSLILDKKLSELHHYADYTNIVIDDRDRIYLPSDFGFSKFDSDFNLLWESDSGDVDLISGMDNKGNILAFGYTHVSRFDSTGKMLWESSIDRRSYRKDHFSEDGALFVNDYYDEINYSTVCKLNKVNNIGDISDLSTFKGNGIAYYRAERGVLTPDQDLFILSTRYSRDLYLSKIDSSGHFLWEKRLSTQPTWFSEAAKIRKISNNRLLISWYEYYPVNEPDEEYREVHKIKIGTFDNEGNLLEMNIVDPNINRSYYMPYCFVSSKRIHYILYDVADKNGYVYDIMKYMTFDYNGKNIQTNSMLVRDGSSHSLMYLSSMIIDGEDNASMLIDVYSDEGTYYDDNYFIWHVDHFGNEKTIKVNPDYFQQEYWSLRLLSDRLDGYYLVFKSGDVARIIRIAPKGRSLWEIEFTHKMYNSRIVVDHAGNIYFSTSSFENTETELRKISREGKTIYTKSMQTSEPGMLKVLNHRTLALANQGASPDLSIIDTESGEILTHYTFSEDGIYGFQPLQALTNNVNDIYLLGNSNLQYMKLLKFNEDFLEIGGDYSQSRVVLGGNYPNPFNGTTNIQYSLPEAGEVNIDIYNAIGQKVDSYTAILQVGPHNYPFKNTYFSSGIYFYSIKFKGSVNTGKMVFVK